MDNFLLLLLGVGADYLLREPIVKLVNRDDPGDPSLLLLPEEG